MRTKPRLLNHELVGARVDFRGERYLVTGAKKLKCGVTFRLLDWFASREFWTGVSPLFENIQRVRGVSSDAPAQQKRQPHKPLIEPFGD